MVLKRLPVVVLWVGALAGGLMAPTSAVGQAAPEQQEAPAPAARAGLAIRYTAVTRVAEANRKQIFADLSACHVEVEKKADALYPAMSVQTRGYSAKKDIKQFRERGRFENAAIAQCTQRALEQHHLEAFELGSIKNEGICKQWQPLSGKPIC
jgi:hypothetical protein